MNEDVCSYLPFAYFSGIGPYRFLLLKSHFKSPENVLRASYSELTSVLGAEMAARFIRFKNAFNAKRILDECQKLKITVLNQDDQRYPFSLRNIPDPPICLFVKGMIEKYNFTKDTYISIIGTRRPTSYGIAVSKMLVSSLSRAGIVTVSGMALGIDSEVHLATLEVNGRTIAFLGSGVDIPTPYSNGSLYEEIIANGGLVFSEYPPGYTFNKGQFVARNRLISGLSKGVLVIEGASDSGTLITARFAAEQGKDVFAVPGPITSIYSSAPHILIKQGAKLVSSADDILDEIGFERPIKTVFHESLDKKDGLVISFLKEESADIDKIVKATALPVSETSQILSLLELKGVIERTQDGKFYLKR